MSQVILAEYGRAKTVNFDLYEVDGVDFRVDAADAGADCSIMKDEGAEGTCANDFVDEGQSYSLVLTAAEMQAARATLLIVDSATKVWLDKHIYIETYGHPSSSHPFMTPYWTNGAVNDGSASSTVWTFDGFTEATADHVIGSELTFTSGANAGQCRTVTDYTSTVITVAPAFIAAPADNDEFVLKAKPQTSSGQVPAVDIASILTDTAVIGALGAGLTDLGGMSTGMKGEVNTEADNSMVTYGLDHLLTTAVAGTDVADNTIIADLVSKSVTSDYDDYVNTTDSLQAARDKLTDIETDTDLIDDGTSGLAKIATDVAAVLVDTGTTLDGRIPTALVGGRIDATIDATGFEDAAVDKVWDEAKSGHVTAGTFGELGHLIVASGSVETSGSNSSTQVQTNLSEATNDHYDVMTILFTSGAEAGQSRLITGYTGSTGVVSWNAALSGTPADSVTFVILSAGTTADAVWDEILTGSSHNIATSAGKRLRQLEQAFTLASGTIDTVTNGHTFTLDTGAVATTDFYEHTKLQIIEGTGAGQSRIIIGYTSGRVATLDSDFVTNPDTSSLYEIVSADVHVSIMDSDLVSGFVATYTNTTTITLDSRAVGTTDYYNDHIIVFTHGTGAGQAREIKAYTSGRVVTMSPALVTALDTTTVYHVQVIISADEIADEVLDEALSGHTTAGSLGKAVADTETNVAAILVDTAVIGALGAGLTDLGGMSTTMKGQINTEVDGALDTAVPASPTADSVNDTIQRLHRSAKTIQEFTVDNTSFTATTTAAQVDAVSPGSLEATDDHYNGKIIIFSTGANIYEATDITDYDGTNKRFTYTAATAAPADNSKFIVI